MKLINRPCSGSLEIFSIVFLVLFNSISAEAEASETLLLTSTNHSTPPQDLVKRAPISWHRLAHPRSIPITNSLPFTQDLSDPLISLWNQALASLSADSIRLTAGALNRAELDKGGVIGIPGTGIETNEEARELQELLDCRSGEGEWVYTGEEGEGARAPIVHKQSGIFASCDKRFYKERERKDVKHSGGEGKWDVRQALKWKWVPSSSCPQPSASSEPLSRRRFCTLLAHKSTLIVGDTPSYSTHDLLLDWTSLKPHSCYGDLYCKQHNICTDLLKRENGVEDFEVDARVYARLSNPPNLVVSPSIIPSSSDDRLIRDDTLLRYRRSDGLRVGAQYASTDYIHPVTGIREINMQWLADSRRSDLVILSKAPLPLPLKGLDENWDKLLYEVAAEKEGKEGMRTIEAAWKITRDVWLPEVLETLRNLRGKGNPERLIVYRGGWRSHADCGASTFPDNDDETLGTELEWDSPGDGPPPHRIQPSLRTLLFPHFPRHKKLTNSHTLFFNLQTILQNHILRLHILPSFGIPFLDLESPLSVWRSGMVGSSASKPFSSSSPSRSSFVDQSDSNHRGEKIGLRSGNSGDCSRYCFPSPGMSLENTFLGGLNTIFERGWARDEERLKKWTGREFVTIKDRQE